MSRYDCAEDFAKDIGVAGLKLRNYLRKNFPRPEYLRYTAWKITPSIEKSARQHFNKTGVNLIRRFAI